jgi:hypothetical protein
MFTEKTLPNFGVPEQLVRTTGTCVNQVDFLVSRTKYAVASGPPYMYFSSSSYVARSIKPDVTLEVQIDIVFIYHNIYFLNFKKTLVNVIIELFKKYKLKKGLNICFTKVELKICSTNTKLCI